MGEAPPVRHRVGRAVPGTGPVVSLVRGALDAAIAVALAPACAACGRVLPFPAAGPVCADCWKAVATLAEPVCSRCGIPLSPVMSGLVVETCNRCLNRAGAIARLRALGIYDGALRDIIHALKYGTRRSLARPLGERAARAGAGVLRGADALVPVPLHPWREWQRGFNQAAAIAREVQRSQVEACGVLLPVWRALRRGRATRPQAELDAAARRTNVRGAFALAGWTRRRRSRWQQQIDGRVLVLVDDVSTTGATLDECATVLAKAGAKEVRALVIARVLR